MKKNEQINQENEEIKLCRMHVCICYDPSDCLTQVDAFYIFKL